MSNVKRYRPDTYFDAPTMMEEADGDYVEYEDYKAALDRLGSAETLLQRACGAFAGMEGTLGAKAGKWIEDAADFLSGRIVEIPVLNPIEKCAYAGCARTARHKGQHMDSGELANYREPVDECCENCGGSPEDHRKRGWICNSFV